MKRSVSLAFAAAAVMVASGCNQTSGSGSSEPTTTAAPAPLPVPTSLTLIAARDRMTLRWTAPVAGSFEQYMILRNGHQLALVDRKTTRFVDRSTAPATRYDYAVRTTRGVTSSASAHASVRTPTPPLTAARVEGWFNVKAKTTSQSGVTGFEVETYAWDFQPRCQIGPCSGKWSGPMGSNTIHGHAERHGARYHMTYNGFFNIVCSEVHTTSAVDIKMRVTRARVIYGEWRATRLTGSLTISNAAQLGCVSSQVNQALDARLHASS